MKQQKILGKNIYPDIDAKVQENIKNFTKKYGIEVDFLFDDGVLFTYLSEQYDTASCPGDLSFIDTKNKEVAIIYIENFMELEFFDNKHNKILSIPILEDYDLQME